MEFDLDDSELEEIDDRSEHRWFFYSLILFCVLLGFAFLSGQSAISEAAAQGAIVGLAMGILAEIVVLIRIVYRKVRRTAEDNDLVGRMKSISNSAVEGSAQVLQSVSERAVKRSSSRKQTLTATKYDNLQKLKQLLDQGALTQEEFDVEKRRVLNSDN